MELRAPDPFVWQNAIFDWGVFSVLLKLQYLVKSVRAEVTPKMTLFAKMLYKSHIINSRALKNI
jgi:hypothetical protein